MKSLNPLMATGVLGIGLLASYAALPLAHHKQGAPVVRAASSLLSRPNYPTAPTGLVSTTVAFNVGQQYNGTATDVMLQGFHWTSSDSHGPDWYEIVRQNAAAIKSAGFNDIWLPPPSKTVDKQGYMPNQWNDLDSPYGTASELKATIQALRPAHALADIVVNHRNGTLTGGADFTNPAFPDNAAAVVSTDECHCGTGAPDTGDDENGSRDLDHTNAGVQAAIEAWEISLKNGPGFSGWRYDMVKGYSGRFVGLYNDASKPYLSVGEYRDDDRQKVVNWLDATQGKSMAFDFPTRTLLKRAVSERNFGLLKTVDDKPTGVIGWWPAMAVTFIDNHDTEIDHENQPFPSDGVMEGYAYILTHPGIPCVFWTHYFDWGDTQKQKLNALISIRKKYHLNSQSVVDIQAADNQKYAAIIDDKVAMKIGPGPWSPGNGWHIATDGNDYAVWVK